MPQLDGLWQENAEAWEFSRKLCSRLVKESHLEGWLIDRHTEGWDIERVMALLDRLELIASVTDPDGPAQD